MEIKEIPWSNHRKILLVNTFQVPDTRTQFKIDSLQPLNFPNQNAIKVRDDANGELADQTIHFPIVTPKIPGRFYYLFGKPIETKGRKELLRDKESANKLYTQIKMDIESTMSYLKEKQEKDPYRGIVDRTIYKAFLSPGDNVPTFDL